MARVDIAAQAPVAAYPALPLSAAAAALVFTAADATNKNKTKLLGGEVLYVKNTGAGARTVTINSAVDPRTQRSGDITADSLAAAAIHRYGPFPIDGWKQSDGYLYFEGSHAEITFCVVRERYW